MDINELGLNEEQLAGVNTYLEESLNSKLQSEGDKIRTKYSKEKQGFETKIGTLNTTIEELKKQLPVQKSEQELQIEKMIKEYEDEKKSLAKEKMDLQLQKQLKDKGLNEQLHKYLKFEGVEDFETYINEIVDVIGKQSNTYKPKSHVQNTNITQEDFKKMTYYQKIELYNNNRELFNTLNGK